MEVNGTIDKYKLEEEFWKYIFDINQVGNRIRCKNNFVVIMDLLQLFSLLLYPL